MSKEVLQSCLLEAGTKFVISENLKDNTFGPGTTGFISYIEGLDDSYQNLARVTVSITRRGKNGKDRLNLHQVFMPIFYFENEAFAELMPKGTRKFYIHPERESEPIESLMDVSDLDFVGWAVAMAVRLRRMNDSCRHKKWPEEKANPLNQIRRSLDHFDEDPPAYLEKLANPDFRTAFIDECRRKASAMIRMHLEFDINKLNAEVNGAEFLLFTNKGEFIPKDAEDKTNEYEFTKDNKLLERSVEYYTKVRDKVRKLAEKKSRKRK
jgi:hypothetical protein